MMANMGDPGDKKDDVVDEGDVMEGDVEQIEGDDVEEVLVDEAEEGGE